MLIQLLFFGVPSKFTPSATVNMKLRHTRWGSDAQDTWTLPYFDVDIGSFGQSDPSSIMNWFKLHHRPRAKPPDDDFGSSHSEPVFHLPSFCLDNIFPPDYDPSEIMHICRFDNMLTKQDLPALFTLLESPSAYTTQDLHTTPPLIVDSGASKCITPLRSDFVKYRPSTAVIHGLSSTCNVAGEGIVNWNVIDTEGNQVPIQVPGYHIPTADVRLFSPQDFFKRFDGHSILNAIKLTLHLVTGEILDAPIMSHNRGTSHPFRVVLLDIFFRVQDIRRSSISITTRVDKYQLDRRSKGVPTASLPTISRIISENTIPNA